MDSKPAQAQTCAVAIPWLQAKLIQVRKQPVTEESAESSFLVPATCISVPASETAARSSRFFFLSLILTSFLLAVKY